MVETRVTDGAVIGGVMISNANKVWWPDEGLTKGDIARFYHAISPLILPWMRDRPLTAERCPDGMLGGCFYRKNFPVGNIPVDAPRLTLRAESTGKDVNYLVGGTLDAMLGLVRVGCIAMHVMNSRVKTMRSADWLAFDLDPTSGEFADVIRPALALHKILDEARLVSFPKTSGSRGLHVFVPLRADQSQDEVTAFAVRIGEELARREPDLVTMEWRKKERGARVYADPFRNAYLQTIVAPYSVRRRPRAPVSTPLDWDEVTPRLDPTRFNVRTFAKRAAKADPWKDFKQKAVRLPA
ncbi:MAG TPA: non-homologous end-joining DNA ligase [Candidatus Acidoferrales bacterium]|nr:non-homologous end-joining DNA ligase [Candidatus Acidoferrales bacterium]